MRPSRESIYMQMANLIAQRSRAIRRKVGAILVKDKRIISEGYNGMPKGFNDECEHIKDYQYVTNQEVLHAEANCILKLAKQGGTGSQGATLFVTTSPCVECAKLIIQAGITQVYYEEEYRDNSGILLLKKAGVKVDPLNTKA